MRRARAAAGSLLFLLVAPGVVAGLVPWLLTGWEARAVWLPVRIVGAALLAGGAAALLHAFARFVVEGLGTPAPVAPTERLVVGGLYRHVRNPMYLAVTATIVGQALLLGRWVLLPYAAVFLAVVAAFVRWYEEPTLQRRFGAEYDEYRRAVPGWWPRRTGAANAQTGHADRVAEARDEFVLGTPVVRAFVADVKQAIAGAASPENACEAIRPRFAELLADEDWLPSAFQADAPESGMGGGIGQWLLYRAGDGSLSLFSLVVPPGSETPIHDHLAWGLVGLYRGTQDEEIYASRNGALELVEQRALVPGDFYVLLPPRDDIHRVRTTSAETSVSIHLLTNDTGCVWRHAYDVASGEARPFRSGYVNVACEEATSAR